ncbi:MAG: hypothetical protein ACFFCD_10860 [Promethearchaeota archaeon]
MINSHYKLLIVTFDDIDILEEIKQRVGDYFQCDIFAKTNHHPKIRISAKQYFGLGSNAKDFLSLLAPLRNGYDFVLGIVKRDLYVPRLKFVMGLANPLESVSIISLARLKSSNKKRYIDRAVKEAIHELGHLLGREHCDNPKCVMRASSRVVEIDRKDDKLCEKCVRLLQI